jgi:hypothetical protein
MSMDGKRSTGMETTLTTPTTKTMSESMMMKKG